MKKTISILLAVSCIFLFACSKPASKEEMPKANTCTVSIDCKSILQNKDKLNEDKKDIVPEDGIILDKTTVSFGENENAYNLLKEVCDSNTCSHKCKYCKKNIQFEPEFNPSFNSYYIEGIHFLYEKDCGNESGWMFKVNGEVPSVSADQYIVNNGDKITFSYICSYAEYM